ncbi:MAG: DUF4838 domain-containing protein, partial [Clostridia bacterium]|nr:DUF4838 domain-containing protein [Clostridia bacterium]
MKKIGFLSVTLAFIMLFSTGCGKTGSSDTPTPAVEPEKEHETILPEPEQPETVDYADDYFVYENSSDYSIVIPRDYGKDEYLAAQEINTFLLRSCGVMLEIKYDDETEYSSESKLISIGNTSLLSYVNISPDANELGDYGFILKTVGSSIFIVGTTKVGTGALYGTYEFLHRQIGWKVYAEDEIRYSKFDSVKLVDVNITDKPDIPGYMLSSYVSGRSELKKRLHISNRTDVLGNGSVSPYHNMTLWLPSHKYAAEHPGWYSTGGDQLCLTCRGDEEEYNAMLNTVFELMYNEVMTYDLKVVTWTLMDNYQYCTCDACVEAERKYGTKSGQLVKFCNELSDMFKARFEENNIDREINILFFAYYYYISPPFKTIDGVQTPTIICRDNVFPIIAPYNEMDRAASIYHDNNGGVKGLVDSWSKICKKFGFWVYSINFGGSYLYPFDPFNCLQEHYKYFADKNPFYMFDEGFTTQFQETPTGFTVLKDYLSTNIAWNTDADVYALTTDFFSNYYKDAAEDMYRFYLSYRMKLKMLFDDYGYSHSNHHDCLNAEFFEMGTLLSWKNHIKNAYGKILKYKDSDTELYKKLDTRIRTESIMVNFMIWKLYGESYYTKTEQDAMLSEIYEDAIAVGMIT